MSEILQPLTHLNSHLPATVCTTLFRPHVSAQRQIKIKRCRPFSDRMEAVWGVPEMVLRAESRGGDGLELAVRLVGHLTHNSWRNSNKLGANYIQDKLATEGKYNRCFSTGQRSFHVVNYEKARKEFSRQNFTSLVNPGCKGDMEAQVESRTRLPALLLCIFSTTPHLLKRPRRFTNIHTDGGSRWTVPPAHQ